MPTPWPEHDGNAKNSALPGSRVKPSPPGGVENIHVFFEEDRIDLFGILEARHPAALAIRMDDHLRHEWMARLGHYPL